MNNGIMMPAKRPIIRPQRCENCYFRGVADNGDPLCHYEPPKQFALAVAPGQYALQSMPPNTRLDWTCHHWRAMVQVATSMGEATAHVSNDT